MIESCPRCGMDVRQSWRLNGMPCPRCLANLTTGEDHENAKKLAWLRTATDEEILRLDQEEEQKKGQDKP